MKNKKIIIAVFISVILIVIGLSFNKRNISNRAIKAIKITKIQLAKWTLDEMVERMSTEEKVAQMFMVRVPENNPVEILKQYQFGGYMLFADHIKGKGKQELTSELTNFQRVAKIPIFVSVDEEGGIVNRVSTFLRKSPFLSPQDIYQSGGMKAIVRDTKEKDLFLKNLKFNVNFAPVADISTNPGDYMYERAFGKGASATSNYVKTVVSQMNKDKMGSVVKHFPGYGNNGNTHTNIVYDKRSYRTFVKKDFLPFTAAINTGVDSILVSHNIVMSMDSKNPASLSQNIHKIIRQRLKFNGVIITDDLVMEGASEFGTSQEVAIKAVQAGNDMIFSSDPINQYNAVLQAVKRKEIDMKQIDSSVIRILEWKQKINLLK